MKDEVAPAEETRPQMPAISSGLPDRGRGGIARRASGHVDAVVGPGAEGWQ